MTVKPFAFAIAAVAGMSGLLWNGELSPGGFISTAQAIIGRPLTPMSYAGVARRTTARAVTATAAVAAKPVVVAPAPVVVAPAPGCVQVVNAYGQVTYRC